jgi:hypothetical protein
VAKRELREQLWSTTFASEATLASVVYELREALGERGRVPTFIRTVRGFGYAFSGVARDVLELIPVTTWIVCNGHEIGLATGEHLLGRDKSSTIALKSTTVSQQHAKIVIAAEIATVEDLGSKTGTCVSGQPVTSKVQLADGDLIRIGGFELTFRTVNGKGGSRAEHQRQENSDHPRSHQSIRRCRAHRDTPSGR